MIAPKVLPLIFSYIYQKMYDDRTESIASYFLLHLSKDVWWSHRKYCFLFSPTFIKRCMMIAPKVLPLIFSYIYQKMYDDRTESIASYFLLHLSKDVWWSHRKYCLLFSPTFIKRCMMIAPKVLPLIFSYIYQKMYDDRTESIASYFLLHLSKDVWWSHRKYCLLIFSYISQNKYDDRTESIAFIFSYIYQKTFGDCTESIASYFLKRRTMIAPKVFPPIFSNIYQKMYDDRTESIASYFLKSIASYFPQKRRKLWRSQSFKLKITIHLWTSCTENCSL